MQKVIELKSRFYETFLQQAKRYAECRKFRKAIKEYTKAIELQPGDWRAYFYRGRAYQRLTQGTQSWEDLKTTAKLGTPRCRSISRFTG